MSTKTFCDMRLESDAKKILQHYFLESDLKEIVIFDITPKLGDIQQNVLLLDLFKF